MAAMPLRWKLDTILERHDISAYRVAKNAGVGLTTIYRIKNNKSETVQGEVLDSILQTIHDLTGVEYGVGDILEWEPKSLKQRRSSHA